MLSHRVDGFVLPLSGELDRREVGNGITNVGDDAEARFADNRALSE